MAVKTLIRPLSELGRRGIRGIDWILRRAYRVEEFTDDPGCIIRIAPGQSNQTIILSDGTHVHRGDPLLLLHLWNEHLLKMPRNNTALGWGRYLLQRANASLHKLGSYLDEDPKIKPAVALHAELGFVTDLRAAETVLGMLGFDVYLKESPSLRLWRRAFWDNLYSSILMWVFSPISLRGKPLHRLSRVEVWMSMERFVQRYRASDALH